MVNFVVVTLFYQTAIDHVYFYEINLRNLLYVIVLDKICDALNCEISDILEHNKSDTTF
ncbi:helix-turn-helix domain-containing protein [Parabacteroides goldsteinii]|uniref:helix-turn-helix domain-containing protein n=1 Tax=Parabacteroides goldsteinii TaxID=328812 RepID=UPI003340AB82